MRTDLQNKTGNKNADNSNNNTEDNFCSDQNRYSKTKRDLFLNLTRLSQCYDNMKVKTDPKEM